MQSQVQPAIPIVELQLSLSKFPVLWPRTKGVVAGVILQGSKYNGQSCTITIPICKY